MKTRQSLADFGGGCFWGVEEVFRKLGGVVKTTVGYEGGHLDNPTYEQVCAQDTGHAETVQIIYDPAKISYSKLLEVFFKNHDPTQLNRQGADEGENYRSVIFYHNQAQKNIAKSYIEKIATQYDKPIVTQLTPATTFWQAEEYHQQYLYKRSIKAC